MSQPTATADGTVLRAGAIAAPGLLARIAAVLNSHPVSEFQYAESDDGTAIITVRIGPHTNRSAEWHAGRVAARLNRVVDVTSIEHVR